MVFCQSYCLILQILSFFVALFYKFWSFPLPYFTSDPQQEVEYKELIQKVRQEIVLTLQAITGVKITPEDTLVILDEIQEVPRGLHSL